MRVKNCRSFTQLCNNIEGEERYSAERKKAVSQKYEPRAPHRLVCLLSHGNSKSLHKAAAFFWFRAFILSTMILLLYQTALVNLTVRPLELQMYGLVSLDLTTPHPCKANICTCTETIAWVRTFQICLSFSEPDRQARSCCATSLYWTVRTGFMPDSARPKHNSRLTAGWTDCL